MLALVHFADDIDRLKGAIAYLARMGRIQPLRCEGSQVYYSQSFHLKYKGATEP